MSLNIQEIMRQATRLTQGGSLRDATEQIQRALKDAGLPGSGFMPQGAGMPAAPSFASFPSSPSSPSFPFAPTDAGTVIDGCVTEVNEPGPTSAPQPRTVEPGRAQAAEGATTEAFTSGSHSHAGRTLAYKLYVPPHAAGQRLPMLVLLHGCTQNPDDFAAGTGMNELAREQGFCVLYPAQAQDANPSKCWNWFKHNHQSRTGGEPAVIASLTQAVAKSHGIDADRIYVAGLSAGGAMAAILGETHPELFAGIGVHSGLPHGAARDMPGAFAVMKSGVGTGSAARANPRPARPVPTIVFHGDRDETVHPLNGQKVIDGALTAAQVHGSGVAAAPQVARTETGSQPGGRRYTRTVHQSAGGKVLAEHWVVHGAGHAWSGGRPQGSYTDASGPNASREMMRFFASHGRHSEKA
ncbi:MAG: hypothetical protein JWQ88_3915 [Rhodoferax sp.]|nr:hypothetical protein [Rhodoferax sp.]